MEHQKFDKEPKEKEFTEKLVTLNRTAKVVKGGRRFSFAALTVVGDQKGRVGYGFGKANDVSEAIKKSIDRAKRNLVAMPLKKGTIPHEIIGKYKSSSVLLKPACSGTGIKAGGAVRAPGRRRHPPPAPLGAGAGEHPAAHPGGGARPRGGHRPSPENAGEPRDSPRDLGEPAPRDLRWPGATGLHRPGPGPVAALPAAR